MPRFPIRGRKPGRVALYRRRFLLTGAEAVEHVDSAEVYLALIASGVEDRESSDAVTVPLTLTPSGVEFQAPTETGIGRIELTGDDEPITRTDHVLRVAASVANGAHSGVLRFQLYELSTAIGAEFETSTLTDTASEYVFEIPDADAEDIVNYADLEVEFYGHSANGDPVEFRIHEIELEIPAAVAGEQTDAATVYLSLTPASDDVAQFVDQATVPLDLQAITTDEERQQYDADIVYLDISPTSVDIAQFVDSAAVLLDLETSGTDVIAAIELAAIYLDLEASGTDEYITPGGTEFTDSDTIYLDIVATSVEERQQYDEAIVPIALVITTVDIAQLVDSATAYLDLQPDSLEERVSSDAALVLMDLLATSVEFAEMVDAASAYLDLQASGIDELSGAFTDAQTIPISLQALSADIQEAADAQTVPIELEASGSDIAQFVESATAYLDLLASSIEEYARFDADTIYFDLQPTSADIAEFSDTTVVGFVLTPSGIDTAQFVEVAIVPLTLTAGFITEHVDTQVVYLKLTPSEAAIILAVLSAYILGQRYTATFDKRWKGDMFRRWLR